MKSFKSYLEALNSSNGPMTMARASQWIKDHVSEYGGTPGEADASGGEADAVNYPTVILNPKFRDLPINGEVTGDEEPFLGYPNSLPARGASRVVDVQSNDPIPRGLTIWDGGTDWTCYHCDNTWWWSTGMDDVWFRIQGPI